MQLALFEVITQECRSFMGGVVKRIYRFEYLGGDNG